MFDLRESRSSHGRRMLGIGLLLGAAVGASAALLMAPASGEETRRVIKRRARRLADRGSAAMEDSLDEARKSARLAYRKARNSLSAAAR